MHCRAGQVQYSYSSTDRRPAHTSPSGFPSACFPCEYRQSKPALPLPDSMRMIRNQAIKRGVPSGVTNSFRRRLRRSGGLRRNLRSKLRDDHRHRSRLTSTRDIELQHFGYQRRFARCTYLKQTGLIQPKGDACNALGCNGIRLLQNTAALSGKVHREMYNGPIRNRLSVMVFDHTGSNGDRIADLEKRHRCCCRGGYDSLRPGAAERSRYQAG